ncbi:hypothetical protein BJ165DRAFT_345110 [Panaeolus papilionaceus]|nr:hypothetical protein BJ165DRAFT_345110 [Panaeolus papilionaceus]
MRDNMLVNVSGLPGHAMGIDMNIEHLIRYLKTIFTAKGIHSNWDQLGNISASINSLQKIKRQVAKSLKSGYTSRSHKDVDTSSQVWLIAQKAQELKLQTRLPNRKDNKKAKPVLDVHFSGYQKYFTSSLRTFNQKLESMKEGVEMADEVDDISPVDIELILPDEDDDDDEGDSLLHDDTDN